MPAFCWPGWKTPLTEPQHGMSKGQLALIHEILAKWLPAHEVRLFGSRARGTPKAYSDLDLVIMGDTPTPLNTMGQLHEAFANSDLPWRVDLVDWADTSPEFRLHIANHSIPLPARKPQ
jgi:predicted nucleotidyltransferase